MSDEDENMSDDEEMSPAGSVDSLPEILPLYSSYGSGHCRPLLALSLPCGFFKKELDIFQKGMPILCKYIVDKRSYGWYTGIIDKIYSDKRADIEYDDGTYDYGVHFKHLRFLAKQRKRTFSVDVPPAPEAIVLSIPHARASIENAHRVVESALMKLAADELKKSDLSEDGETWSDDELTCTCASSSSTLTTPCDLDNSTEEVEFVMQSFDQTRGTVIKPIVLD